jgi:hypothetical protein
MKEIELQQAILEELRSMNRTIKNQLRTNRCVTTIIDLTVAHTNEPLGLKYKDRNYLFLDVERADSAFTYILGQPNSPIKSEIFTAPTGLFFHEYTEIYVTNAVAIGIGIILSGWLELR